MKKNFKKKEMLNTERWNKRMSFEASVDGKKVSERKEERGWGNVRQKMKLMKPKTDGVRERERESGCVWERGWVYVYVCVHVCMRERKTYSDGEKVWKQLQLNVCVRESERIREREWERERMREREWERENERERMRERENERERVREREWERESERERMREREWVSMLWMCMRVVVNVYFCTNVLECAWASLRVCVWVRAVSRKRSWLDISFQSPDHSYESD